MGAGGWGGLSDPCLLQWGPSPAAGCHFVLLGKKGIVGFQVMGCNAELLPGLSRAEERASEPLVPPINSWRLLFYEHGFFSSLYDALQSLSYAFVQSLPASQGCYQ